MKKINILLVLLVLGGIAFWLFTGIKNKITSDNTQQISSFAECAAAGYPIMESYPEQCSDGVRTFTRVLSEEELGVNNEVDQQKDIDNYGEYVVQNTIPDFYTHILMLEENIFDAEVSRSLKDCMGVGPQKCLQVKKQGGEWALLYDPIYGFNYIEGDYYVLSVREVRYDFSNTATVPADAASQTWQVLEVIKHVPSGNDDVQSEMIVKIPRVEFSSESGSIVTQFDQYTVPKKPEILSATLEKLFQLRSLTNNSEQEGQWNGFAFDSVSIIDTVAVIKLSGSWFPAGDLSALYFKQEIESAVLQYLTVDNVRVLVDDKIFDWCIDDMSDGEGGCPEEKQLWDTTIYKGPHEVEGEL